MKTGPTPKRDDVRRATRARWAAWHASRPGTQMLERMGFVEAAPSSSARADRWFPRRMPTWPARFLHRQHG